MKKLALIAALLFAPAGFAQIVVTSTAGGGVSLGTPGPAGANGANGVPGPNCSVSSPPNTCDMSGANMQNIGTLAATGLTGSSVTGGATGLASVMDGTGLNFGVVSPSTTCPTYTASGTGVLTATYQYQVSYGTAGGSQSLNASQLTCPTASPSSQTVVITNLPVSTNPAVTSRYIWRHNNAWTGDQGDPHAYQLVAIVNDNTTTSYTDNVADASLGVAAPWLDSGFRSISDSDGTLWFRKGYNSLSIGSATPGLVTGGLGGYANVGIGQQALQNTTYGWRNNAFGVQALSALTTGSGNSGFGTHACNSLTTGDSNVCVGDYSLFTATTSTANTAVGFGAIRIGTASNDTAVGLNALKYDSSAGSNTAIGWGACGATPFTALRAFCGGFNTFANLTSGADNTAVGYNVGGGITTGTSNTLFGSEANQNGGNTNWDTLMGYKTGFVHTGNGLTAVGYEAAMAVTGGGSFTAIGWEALLNATGGSNTGVGSSAGATVVAGVNNTLLGASADVSSGAINNCTAAGQGAVCNANNQSVIGNASVTDVYFGSTAAAAKLHAANFVGNAEFTVTFSGTPTYSATSSANILTLTGNVTGGTIAAGQAGQRMSMLICQDSTGGWTFTWPSTMHGGMTIGSTLSTCSGQEFVYSVVQTAWIATAAVWGNVSGPGSSTVGHIALFGNTSGTTLTDSGVSIAGASSHVASSFCTGTATSSSTLALFGMGATQTACTGAAVSGSAFQLPVAGTLGNLTVSCSTTGVNASSGVFTIYTAADGVAPNSGSASALTVTYGTTTADTAVVDSTHTLAVAAKTKLQVRFTTQATETLANCKVSFTY